MPEAIDWSILPAKFKPYIPAIEKYGSIQFENDIIDTIRALTPEELTEVRGLRKTMDLESLHLWVTPVSIVDNRVYALAYFFLSFIGYADEFGVFNPDWKPNQ